MFRKRIIGIANHLRPHGRRRVYRYSWRIPEEDPVLRLVSSERPSLDIDRDSAVLGRDQAADVSIDDRSVSRRHARVYREGEGWRVEDLKSANGTFLDGNRVTIAPLSNGQELRLGSVAWRVEIAGEDPRATLLISSIPTPVTPATVYTPPPVAPRPPAPPAAPAPAPAHAPAYAPPVAAATPTPAPRASGGGIGTFLVIAVVLYFAYDHFSKKQQAPAAPGPASLRIASVKVEKTKNPDGGEKILIRTIVEGFGSKEAEGGYSVSVAEDIETVTPDGQRIEGLSKQNVNVLEKVVESNENLNATLDFFFTVNKDASGTITSRIRVRDQIGGGEAKKSVDITVP
jgi:hypothetical protein